jgi:hypothetical protein
MSASYFANDLIQKYLFLALCYGDDWVYTMLQKAYEDDDSYDGHVIRDIIDVMYDYRDTSPLIMRRYVMTVIDAPRVMNEMEHTMDEWIHSCVKKN